MLLVEGEVLQSSTSDGCYLRRFFTMQAQVIADEGQGYQIQSKLVLVQLHCASMR